MFALPSDIPFVAPWKQRTLHECLCRSPWQRWWYIVEFWLFMVALGCLLGMAMAVVFPCEPELSVPLPAW